MPLTETEDSPSILQLQKAFQSAEEQKKKEEYIAHIYKSVNFIKKGRDSLRYGLEETLLLSQA